MARARGSQAASPLYGGSRKLASSQQSMSLLDFMKESGADDLLSPTDTPLVPSPAFNLNQKFNRAVRRLHAARKLESIKSDLQQSTDGSAMSYIQIKKLISKPEIRQDVASAAPSCDNHTNDAHCIVSKNNFESLKSLNALRANSFGMIIWNLIQVVLLLYIIAVIPYRFSFANLDNTSCKKEPVLEGIDLFLDTFYLFDIVVSACTQSVSDQGIPLLSLKETVHQYVWNWVFVRDLVPAIPMSWIDYAQTNEDCASSSTVTNAGITKLLRILRIFRIFRVFKLFNVKFINDSLRNVDPNVKTLATLFTSLLVLVHLLASIWFFVKKNSSSISAWYIEQGLDSGDHRSFRVYLSCVYYIVATLATVGFGDIAADHQDERIMSIGIMLLGTVVFALIISTASMIAQNANMDDAAHGSKIALVHEFCSEWKLSEALKYEILDFFLCSKDIFIENANTKKVLKSIPPEYQYAVAPHVAKECLGRTVLFTGCTPQFMSLLLEMLSLESYGAGEVIFQTGDVSDGLYIIKNGNCLLLSDGNTVMAELSDTDIFGEVSCLMSAPRSYSCICSKFCEMYVLRVPQLVKMLKAFPDFMMAFQNYCRRKTLVHMSAKLQVSSLFHKLSTAPSSSSFPTSPPSPPLSCQHPNVSLFQSSHIPLKPLPKGKYRPPIVPHFAEIVHLRAIQSTNHAERIRLFAQIQVTFVPFSLHPLILLITSPQTDGLMQL